MRVLLLLVGALLMATTARAGEAPRWSIADSPYITTPR